MNQVRGPAPDLPDARLLISMPPYDGPVVATTKVSDAPDGTLVLFDFRHTPPDRAPAISSLVRKVRKSAPGVAIGGVLPPASLTAWQTVRSLTTNGLRFWITNPVDLAQIRRSACPRVLPVLDFDTWLTNYLSPRGLREVGLTRLIARAVACEELSKSTTREAAVWCRHLGLPSLRSWCALGRLISGVNLLQAVPEATVEVGARTAGYADASTFSHACTRFLGTPPSGVRDKLGWEWVFLRFLRRERR